MAKTRMLIAEDDAGAAEALRKAFGAESYEVQLARTGIEARDAFRGERWDVVLTDVVMPDMDGLTLLKELVAAPQAPPVIVMTAYGSIERAVQAMKDGAFDFMEKPLDLDSLRSVVRSAVEGRSREPDNRAYRAKLKKGKHGLLMGQSPLMHDLVERALRVAQTNATVMLQGESGTGKELLARLIHTESLRVRGPFVPVNSAGLTQSIIESELFGHTRGAFTGAIKDKKGKFELADGGTLFLDEIGEIPLNVQVKLLRVLQEREIERVGGEAPIKVDVRLVSATHRDLPALIKTGEFREDLYYRVKVIVLQIPPLRERSEDIPELAEHFRKTANERNDRTVEAFTPAALEALCGYGWPGNVRELENVVEQAVVLATTETVDVDGLPEEVTGRKGPQEVLHIPVGTSLKQTEKDLILETLRKVGGNKTQAARLLGIGVRTLYRKLDEYGETS
ncbi:MAG: sigma-54-dependent transcriptional regulator [Planctomycetota bacterium]